MTRINLLTAETAPEGSKEILNGFQQKMGKVINIFKVMANAPAALKAYLGISGALEEKVLDNAIAERIGLALASVNGCEYCTSAHSYLAKGALSDEEIVNARKGKSDDAKAQAALDFAVTVMKNAGKVSDEELEKVKNTGFTNGEILEIIVVVTLNFFTNAINNVAQTTVDFPKIKE
jgi:uncharacterized peroxidase-related enzyme